MEKRSIPTAVTYLIFVQIFAVLLTVQALSIEAIPEPYQPFGGETVTQATANSLLLLLLVVTITLVFIFLILKLRFLFAHVIIFLSIFAAFFITLFYAVIITSSLLALPLTIMLILILLYGLVKNIYPIVIFSIFLVSAEIGSYLSLILLPPTLFILPLVFSVYDIYAVFKGPLKTLIKILAPRRNMKKATSRIFGLFLAYVGGFGIGTGDLIFSAMLVSAAYILIGLIGIVAVGIAVNIGFLITLKLLVKYKRPIPALPISMFLGTLVFILLYYF
ncbi:MAG: hypothetical protein QMD14_04980 [Candidatus Aenigmarchaeota archaeon]|nr:hypothetical protein [Candidatus Aenigmarchaeota archaeon]